MANSVLPYAPPISTQHFSVSQKVNIKPGKGAGIGDLTGGLPSGGPVEVCLRETRECTINSLTIRS